MGWNGSDRRGSMTPQKPKATAKKPSPVRGLIAGLVVVLAAAACYFAFFSKPEKPAETEPDKKTEPISEVTPAPAPKPQPKEDPKAKPAKPAEPEKFVPPVIPPGTDPQSREAIIKSAKWKWKLLHDQRLRNFLEKHKPEPAMFKSGEEQVIDWIFSCKVGDQVPPPLPQMQEFEKNHLLEILETACEVKEDDDAQTVERKKVVDDVKKELAEYVKQGGKVQDFLEYYRNELVKARETKALVASEVRKAIDSGDPDVGVQTLDKGNKILRDKGISEVELDEDQLQQLQDGLNKQKGQTE